MPQSPMTDPVTTALCDVEEAIEIGSDEDLLGAAAALGRALGDAASATTRALFNELHALTAATTGCDRATCARVCAQIRAHGWMVEAEPMTLGASALRAQGGADARPSIARPPAAPTATRFGASADGWTVAAESVDMLRDFALEARALLDEAEGACLSLDAEIGAAAIAAAFRAFHTIKGVAGFLELAVLAAVAHRTESVLAEIRDGAPPPEGFVDLILHAVDVVRGCITVAAQHGAGDRPDVDGFLADLAAVLDELTRPQPERLATTVIPSMPKVAATSAIKVEDADERAVVKVDIGKMDHIIDLVGELAIAHAQVAGHPELGGLSSRDLLRAIGLLGRVAKDLQHASLAMRMVAIKGTFERMARIARDTARGLGKPLTFAVEGAHTELDRTMVEAIYDPLVHLIRNAIDHGLEGPIERVRRGKPEAGVLTLRAFHQAGHIVVEVADDGGGLDRNRIRARAIELGLIAAEVALSDGELDQLIFAPGFSTAAAVTSVSGRGVGMDVVKTKVEAVRGRVEIASVPGAGTTFRLKLPLTLAIIDGLLLRVGAERYVMPTSWARDVFRPAPEQLVSVRGRGQMVKVRGALYPILHLAERLGVATAAVEPTQGVLVMVDDGSRAVCLVADELLGQQEVVVKGLGTAFANLSYLAGATILGDGRIALILDIPAVVGAAGERRVDRQVA